MTKNERKCDYWMDVLLWEMGAFHNEDTRLKNIYNKYKNKYNHIYAICSNLVREKFLKS